MIVSDIELDHVRLGRRRLLAGIGGALTTAAATFWFPARASSTCPLPGCFGYAMCPSCSGTQCTSSGCTAGFFGCPTGVQCWGKCVSHNQYKCCDWQLPSFPGDCGYPPGYCICRGYLGSC